MEFKPLPLESEEEFKKLPLESSEGGDFKALPVSSDGFKALPLESGSKRSVKPQEEPPFSARHPNLYGVYGAAKETGKELSKVAWLKYIYPDERKKFLELDKQHQVRDLLYQDLEFATLAQFKPIAQGIKNIAAPTLERFLPKTYKMLTKQAGKGVAGVAESVVAEPAAETASQKMVRAIKEAGPVRAEQEALYKQARAERISKATEIGEKVSGEKGYYAELAEMKGEMPKAVFESIRNKIGQEDIDLLFRQVKDSGTIGRFEKLTARRGLAKMFGEFGGGVPTEGELKLLNKVFGEEFVKTVLSKRPLFAKMKEAGLEIANIPRAIMASFDLSAPLRQGIFFIGRPKQFGPAFSGMFKYFFSEKAYATLAEDIAKRPTFRLMKDAKLAITDLGIDLTSREERFMSSWAEKIPVIGRGVRASGRAYTGFLNKLRADVFDDMVKKGAELGIDDSKFLASAANFINTATGRGGLGSLENSAVQLNAFFFSPRLIASRLNLVNPVYYGRLHPQVRKEALKSLFTFSGIASTVGGLATLGGADVGVDPRSADFMKLKFGNTRYDILGGFQQPIRAAAQLISGEVVSSTTGKVMTIGEGYKPLTRTDIITRFLASKEAPVTSFITSLLRGKTGIGEKVDIPTEVANRFVPMVMQDMYDLYQEEGAKGVPMAIPAIFGVGVMSYGGVASFGMNGKDYPKLNKELTRLKTSMGYPSTIAFGEDLSNKEYKLLKEKTGKAIAANLMKLIHSPEYNGMEDRIKVRAIEQNIDIIKNNVKQKTFPDKMIKSQIRSNLKALGTLSDAEIERKTEEIISANRR